MPEMLLCKCGCGTFRSKFDKNGIRRYFIQGHGGYNKSKVVNIPRDVLKKLYIDEEKTAIEIALMFACSNGYVFTLLRKYNIPIRKTKFRNNNTPWIKGRYIVNPDLCMSDDLAYVLGVFYGDGFSYKGYLIGLDVTSLDFAKSFQDSIRRLGLHASRIRETQDKRENRKKRFKVTSYSKKFCDYFSKPDFEKLGVDLIKKKSWILAFLRGFYESEGHIGYYGGTLHVVIVNTDIELAELVKKILTILNMRYSWYEQVLPSSKTLYKLSLLGSATEKRKFIEELDPVIKRCPR